jgi:hypothetical protein
VQLLSSKSSSWRAKSPGHSILASLTQLCWSQWSNLVLAVDCPLPPIPECIESWHSNILIEPLRFVKIPQNY